MPTAGVQKACSLACAIKLNPRTPRRATNGYVVCKACNQTKPHSAFSPQRTFTATSCKDCRNTTLRIERERKRVYRSVTCRCGVVFQTSRPEKKNCSFKCRRKGGDYKLNSQWNPLRHVVLRRRKYTCDSCGARPGPRRLDVDHVIPAVLMPSFGLSVYDKLFLVPLCKRCHCRKTTPEKWLRDGDIDGFLWGLRCLNFRPSVIQRVKRVLKPRLPKVTI